MGNAEKVIGYATINTEKCRRPSQGMQMTQVICTTIELWNA